MEITIIIMKKRICTIIFVIGLLLYGCNTTDIPQYKTITLTQEEAAVLQAMGADIHVVDNNSFEDTVSAISEHPDDYVGQVYQFEGIFSMQDVHGESAPYLMYSDVENDKMNVVGLPLLYLEKDVDENAAIRVTAIVGVQNHDGHSHAVLEVVAVESVNVDGKNK